MYWFTKMELIRLDFMKFRNMKSLSKVFAVSLLTSLYFRQIFKCITCLTVSAEEVFKICTSKID